MKDLVQIDPVDREMLWKHQMARESPWGHWRLGLRILGPTISSAGAVGAAQIVPKWGPGFAADAGVEWSPERLRNDPEYNMLLGKTQSFKLLKKYGGDPAKALSAYNYGPTATNALIEKYGSDWQRHLPKETKDYIRVIMGNYGKEQAQIYSGEKTPTQSDQEPLKFTPHQESNVDLKGILDRNDQEVAKETPPPQVQSEVAQQEPAPAANSQTPPVVAPDLQAQSNFNSDPIPPESPAPVVSQAQPVVAPQQEKPVAPVDVSFIETDATIGPHSIGATDPQAVPGVDSYPTPYYESQGALSAGVRNNEGYLDRTLDRFKQSAEDGTLGTLANMALRWEVERENTNRGINKLDPEEANRMYPGLPAPFTEPVDPGVASLIHGDYRRRKADAAWNESGPGIGWYGELGVGIGSFAGDPINLAGVGAIGAGIEKLGFHGLKAVLSSNALIAGSSEALTALNRAQEHDPLTAPEVVANVGLNTLFGTVFHYGVEFTAPFFKDAIGRIKNNSPGQAKVIINRFRKGTENGQKVSVAAEALDQTQGEAGRVPPGSNLEHTHNENVDLETTPFFIPFREDKALPIGDELGATIAVDNPNSARNTGDSVRELEAKGRFADLRQPVTAPEISDVLKSAGVEVPKDGTLGDLLRSIRDSHPETGQVELKRINEAFKEAGFAGYRDHLLYNGVPVSNRLHVFNADELQYGPARAVDPAKVYSPSSDELNQRQMDQDAPDNSVETKLETPEEVQRATKLSEPNAEGVPEQSFLEGERARKTLDALAETDPDIKEELRQIDELAKREGAVAPILKDLMDGDLSREYRQTIKEKLASKGETGTQEMVDELGAALDQLREKSFDEADFKYKANKYYQKEVMPWAVLKKIERTQFLAKTREARDFIDQTVHGRSKFQKLYSLVIGGETKLGWSLNKNTGLMSDGYSSVYLSRLKKAWGPEGVKIVESGLIGKDMVQELSNLGAGGTKAVSGNELAFKLAKDFHDISKSLFSAKLGYNPFLSELTQHIFKQTHSRELVSAAKFEDWYKFVSPRYEASSFPELSKEQALKRFKNIHDQISQGYYGSSSFDRAAGESNIAYKMAKGRTLIPNDWKAFYEYNEKFGKGDLGMTLMDTIRATGRDLAVMSKFTSQPRKFMESLINYAKKTDPKFEEEFAAGKSKFEAAFAAATFQYQAPALNPAARALTGAQKLISVAVNGMSWLRSFQDFGPAATQLRDHLGGNLFSNFSDVFSKYWKYFRMGGKEAANASEELGVFSQSAHRNLHVELGGDATTGPIGRMVELHSWASLMERHAASMSAAIADVVSTRLARIARTPYADLPLATQEGLLKYGIGMKEHSVLPAGIETREGVEYLHPGSMLAAFEKTVDIQATLLGVDPKDIVTLETSPKVKTRSSSAYTNEDIHKNPYAETQDAILAPRPEEGANLGEISKAYSPDGASKIAKDVHDSFTEAGFSPAEASIPSTLISTFFDSVGKAVDKDPMKMFKKYGLDVQRLPQSLMDALGYLSVKYEGGQGDLNLVTLKGIAYDKTVIHEMSHFFLETLRDVKLNESPNGNFNKGMGELFKWLGTDANGNVNVAAHERFANSFEVYLRTNKAPTTALEKVFATVRDWYRRALFMAKAGLSRAAFSLAKPERAPLEVENFYRSLMGGEGATEHLGDLTSLMEMLPQEDLARAYSPLDYSSTPLPSKVTDLIMNIAALHNEHAQMGNTTASMRDRVFMYGGSDVNSLPGMLLRTLWAFKSSAVSQVNSMRRSFYSNPEKPQGDWTKVAHFAAMAMGLWAIQDKISDLLQNKTPKDMFTKEYGAQAIIGSGALGILGDTVGRAVVNSSDEKGAELELFKSIFPTLGTFGSATMTGARTVKSWVDPRTKFPGNDVGKNLIQNIPFQNLFWLRGVMHSYFLDGIREFFSPGFKAKQNASDARRGQGPVFGGGRL